MVEVVVAMFIISIVIAGLIPALALNIRSNYMAKNYGVANYLAQRKIEQIRSWPQYQSITLSDESIVQGIDMDNDVLFTDEVWGDTICSSDDCTHIMPGIHETFRISAVVMRNGHGDADSGGSSECRGFTFGGAIGTGFDDKWLNTTPLGAAIDWPEDFTGDCDTGKWRGEDFMIIRVNVKWTDKMRNTKEHTIDRQAYIAEF
jgi:type II secretory pathway pseudopilin PulG